MTRIFHWTLILLATATILAIVTNIGALSGTGFHVLATLTVALLTTFVFIYWLVRGLYKRQWVFALKVLLTPFLIFTIHYLVNYDRIQMDGRKAELYAFLAGEDSNYSADFSHHAFNKIKIGMTKKEVLELIGEPLQKYPWDNQSIHTSNKLAFRYCMTYHDTNYRIRVICFTDDTVTRVCKEFYYD